MHLVGTQNIELLVGIHEMENFKIFDEILASLESLYSTQCIVCSSILTLLTFYIRMNNYKRSLRLKFSTGFIHKDEELQIHLQTCLPSLFWWPKWSFLLSPPWISQTNCTVTYLHSTLTLVKCIPVSHNSRVTKRIKVKI